MNRSEIDAASLRTLASQVSTSLCWIILGPIGAVSNMLIIYTILSSKNLKNRGQFVIMSHSISEMFNCLGYVAIGAMRYISYLYQIPGTSTQLVCIFKQMPLYILANAAVTFCFALATDRFLCIAFPIFYKTRNTTLYLFLMNGVIWGLEVVRITMMLSDYNPNLLLSACTAMTSFSTWFNAFAKYDSPFFVCGTAFMYFVTCCILYYRYRKVKSAGEATKSEWRKQMDLDVFVAMVVVGVIFLSTYGISAGSSFVSGYFNNAQVSLALAPVSSIAILVNTISHLFVYLKVNSRFRQEFKRKVLFVWKKQNTQITPSGQQVLVRSSGVQSGAPGAVGHA